MKIKAVLAVVAVYLSMSLGQVCVWNANTDYKAGDVVLFQGVRYIAVFENKGVSPQATDNNEIGIWRIVEFNDKHIPSRTGRAFPQEHIRMSRAITGDPFVNSFKNDLPFGFHRLRDVGISNEKFFVGDFLHSSWTNFMVTKAGEYRVNRNLRNVEFYREYLNYRDFIINNPKATSARTDENRSSPLEEAFEQIIHNIVDAGIAFSHALGNYSNARVLSEHDAREEAFEYALAEYINRGPFNIFANSDNRDNLMSTVFIGTIYDAIDLYESRVRTAIRWGIQKIPPPTSGNKCYAKNPRHGSRYFARKDCYDEYSTYFDYFIHGNGTRFHNGEPVFGVTRSAMAVGRFIMIDAILARKPIENARITPSATNIGLDSGASLLFTAFARDPDAIRFELKEGKSDDGNPNSYRIQHDPSAHDMFYQWLLNDKDGNEVRFPSSQTKTDSLIMTVIDTSGITGEDDKKNGFLRVRLSNGKESNLETTVRVTNSRFTIRTRFQDDEKDTAFASREVSVFNRLPEANFQTFRGARRTDNPYLALVHRRDFAEHTQEGNRYRVHSGFGGEENREPLYISGLASWDPDGNESDQIVLIEYDIDNNNTFEWNLPGINQAFDKKGEENKFVLRSSFSLSSEEDMKVKGHSQTYFISSSWNNLDSPDNLSTIYDSLAPNRNHAIRYRITDNENSSLIGEINIPLLAPPRIDSVEIGTMRLCSGQIGQRLVGQTTTELLIRKNAEDNSVFLYASATDADDPSGALSYSWGFSDPGNPWISLTNPNWEGNITGASVNRTYQDLIKLGLSPGVVYDVILKVGDNDNTITQRAGFSEIQFEESGEFREPKRGITMMKVGRIRLE